MPKKSFLKLVKWRTLVTVSILVLFVIWVSQSKVTLTSSGVYNSLELPLGSNYIRVRADYAAHASEPKLLSPALQGLIIHY
ncbi:hypothetical protein ACSLBF_13820 [Pseudoalteromonas sp. T1lg65]|uniref:hypothetical protein n=1 Tax=Pseudoalteromonas sp. T1lg65 TaxID=2077101 RepID=UPI003F79C5CE